MDGTANVHPAEVIVNHFDNGLFIIVFLCHVIVFEFQEDSFDKGRIGNFISAANISLSCATNFYHRLINQRTLSFSHRTLPQQHHGRTRVD
jgi:uncharacterized membrane protein